MLRTNWRVIVAAVGLVLLSASPPQANRQEPSGTTQHNEATPAPTPTVQQIQESPDLSEPCGPSQDNRDSDLCAQWKAADAARSAADATWLFGAVGSLIGALTLAAAFSAAKWAKQAAVETRRAADVAEAATAGAEKALDIANKNAEAATTSAASAILAQRPWLVINISNPEPVQDLGDMLQTAITIEALNIGNSPAVRYVLASALKIVSSSGDHDAALDIAWQRIEEVEVNRLRHGDTIFPKFAGNWRHGFRAEIGDTPRDERIFLAGAGVVRFEFGNVIAHTAFRFVLTDKDHRPFTINAPAKDLRIELFKLKAEGEPTQQTVHVPSPERA